MYTDPIADFLTRIRNASLAGHKIVDIPSSKIKYEITKILFDQGYVLSYKHEETKNGQGNIKIALKYKIPLVFYGEPDAEYNSPISEFTATALLATTVPSVVPSR